MLASWIRKIWDRLFAKNAVFVRCFGLCSVLAVTTSVVNAIGMGISATLVLTLSYLTASFVIPLFPERFRKLSLLIVVAGWTTAVDLLLYVWFPDLSASLGIFVPLLSVSCLDLFHRETGEIPPRSWTVAVEGFLCGIGYTAVLWIAAMIRELFGTGTLFAHADGSGGVTVWGEGVSIFLLPAGGFLVLGCLWALFRKLYAISADKTEKTEESAQ